VVLSVLGNILVQLYQRRDANGGVTVVFLGGALPQLVAVSIAVASAIKKSVFFIKYIVLN